VLEHGLGQLDHVVNGRGEPPVDHRLGADREHEGLAGARARSPGDHVLEFLVNTGAGARRANELEDGVDHLIANGELAHQALGHHQLIGRQDGFQRAVL
jgi:hypothetical protein